MNKEQRIKQLENEFAELRRSLNKTIAVEIEELLARIELQKQLIQAREAKEAKEAKDKQAIKIADFWTNVYSEAIAPLLDTIKYPCDERARETWLKLDRLKLDLEASGRGVVIDSSKIIRCPYDERDCGLVIKKCNTCYYKIYGPCSFKKGDWLVIDIAGEFMRPFMFVDTGEGVKKQQMVVGTTVNNEFVYYPLSSCKKWKPRNGEKVIGLPGNRKSAFIGIYDRPTHTGNFHLVSERTITSIIPFVSMEQFDKIIKGENQ